MAHNAVLEALRDVWTTLKPFNAPMAVMGGIALAAWEHVRATQDVDLLISVAQERTLEVLDRLERAGFRPKRSPPIIELGGLRLLQLKYQPADSFLELQVDLLLAESEYHRTALERRVPTHLPGLEFEVSVLTCEDLILHKLIAARILDRADCVSLLTANRRNLDREYLRVWSESLGLTKELAEVWQSAFPGESPLAS